MKIEIDLNDILGDEHGAESLQESVSRQVINAVTSGIQKGITHKIDEAVATTISQSISAYLEREMPGLLANIMDAEYVPVGRYGEKSSPTSFRRELVRSINENMVYKRANYESDKNAFTKAVDQVVGSNLKEFKAEFQKQVDAQFTAQAMSYAAESLRKKLGIAQ